MSWLKSIFDDGSLMPHGYCLVWKPGLIWLHVLSDAVIGISYFSIPFALIYFFARRRDVGFGLMFQLFAAFILLCGATHFIEIWTLWHSDYALQGMVKAATALVSVTSAFLVWPALSVAISLPSPAMLRLANDNLSREVDERSSLMQALAREKEFTELLIKSSSECMSMIDRNEIVRVWNPAIAAYSGIKAEDVIGQPIFDMRPGMRETIFHDGIRSALGGYECVVEDQLVIEEQTRPNRWVDARYSPVRGPDGEVIGCLAFVRDTTLRHEMDDRLRQAQKMEAIGQLTGGIAHDFNNYLTAIIGNLDLLGARGGALPQAIEKLRASALQAALKAAALTRQLLAFSRRQILAPHVTDASEIVSGMAVLLRTTMGERVITEMALGEALFPIFVDSNQLESALLNLAINARDAMPDGGRLRIETANVTFDRPEGDGPDMLRGDYVTISVSDTGHGMPAEVKDRAFDPFFTTKQVGQGSGLGLSQVYGIVKQSGGQLRLETEVGTGTTVTLYLPRHRDLVAHAEGSAASDTMPTDARVLILEGKGTLRSLMRETLETLGYKAAETSDVTEAMSWIARASDAELVIVDPGLPDIDIAQFVDHARRRSPGIRVLFVADHPRDLPTSVLEGEATGLLVRPFGRVAFGQRVRDILDSRDSDPPPAAG